MYRVNIILLLAEDIVKSLILSVIRSNHVARPKAQSHVGHQAAGGGREYGPLQVFFSHQSRTKIPFLEICVVTDLCYLRVGRGGAWVLLL
jgi:hypothetical protein